jgi:arsenical pump membrane protein
VTAVALITRIARIEHADGDDRPLLIIDLQTVAGLAVGAVLISAPLLAAPLGRLSSPFALLIVLPPLALALEVFGWRDWLSRHLARAGGPVARLLTAYTVWLVTSALLTLDVAAVAAASVGIRIAGDSERQRRWQLGSAILGANVGSILLPFSNLTNLVLVATTGIGFTAYVAVATGPALAAALAVGLLLGLRASRDSRGRTGAAEAALDPGTAQPPIAIGVTARAAGAVALLGSAVAVVVGLAGSDVAVPFALSSGILAGLAVASGRLDVRAIVRAVPLGGLGVIAVAGVASAPIGMAAVLFPRPDPSIGGLVLALVVGGTLAALANNLPAAVFGASWLVGAPPATIVAYLLGTNVVALATPHGSVATILARAVGHRHAVRTPAGRYLRTAWLYATVGAVAGLVALIVAVR